MKCQKLITELPRYKKNRVLNRARNYRKAVKDFLEAQSKYLNSLRPLARERKKSVKQLAKTAILITLSKDNNVK